MRFGTEGYPLVLLGHRRQQFLERTLASLRQYAHGITDVIVVDDSGDPDHWDWLDDHGYQFSVAGVSGNVGYYNAMQMVWKVARDIADEAGSEYVMLWEEDFWLRRSLSVHDMATVMDASGNERLAQLNLQRQAVYRIEKRYGYLESHQRRGYGLTRNSDAGLPWVGRARPFTTNPGLIRREVLDIDWPTREVCDEVEGGAEPAMSLLLESHQWWFGWFGKWDVPHVQHVGIERKTGHGY